VSLISIVVPVFNERETLAELYRRLTQELATLPHDYELVMVDDGSRDGSTEIIRDLALGDGRVRALVLSRNFGHQAAIEAGMRDARGDAVAVMDADLQDSPEALLQLIAAWEEGADVAYAVRRRRKEGPLLRLAYHVYYRLAGRMMSIELPVDAGPFSIMSRRVVDVLNAMPEYNRYFSGLRAFTGFRQVAVEVERAERLAGETKYSVSSYAGLASNAIVSFSKLPLRAVTVLGIVSAALAILGGIYVLVSTALSDDLTPGWASIMTVVLLLAGLQLVTLGIVGEYVGKVYDEVRRRPTFVVAERYQGGVGLDTIPVAEASQDCTDPAG
jgi:dolichol-phosphate mannosyltransferase